MNGIYRKNTNIYNTKSYVHLMLWIFVLFSIKLVKKYKIIDLK